MLSELESVSTFTPWQMFNSISSRYIVPLINIDSKDKTKQFLNVLANLNALGYRYSLYLEILENSFPSHTNNAIVIIQKIQISYTNKFCICKCLVDTRTRLILDLKKMPNINVQ